MPTVDQNRTMWDRTYDWPDDGDEWSSGWGGPDTQWQAWIEPRLLAALPTRPSTTLEIGCGRGRWTRFLLGRSDDVIAVDIASTCIDRCRERFSGTTGLQCHLVHGSSLPMAADRSVDLVFSFDSLVHADAATLDGYLGEIGRILTTDGRAFLHHSNLAACGLNRSSILRRCAPLRRALATSGLVERDVHWRDPSVSADVVVELAAGHGLRCTEQELVAWSTRHALIDCISVISRAESSPDSPCTRTTNRSFLEEMADARRRVEGGGPGST